MSSFVALEFDAEKQILDVSKKLGSLKKQTPAVLKNAINAAARKVKNQIVKDAQGRYSLNDPGILKNVSQGGPRLYTAKASTMTATISSKGPMQDIMAFMTKPNTKTGAAAAKILNAGSMKDLEMDGLKAFVTTFASGHTAIVQRRGAGRLPVKKLLSPAVPIMLGNEEVREQAERLAYEILQAEIQKRVEKVLKAGA